MDKLNNIVLLIQHYLADYILIILLLGTCNGYCSTGRNGEYCRSGNSIGNRRTGSDFLDVDCGISWNGDHFRRSYYGSEI